MEGDLRARRLFLALWPDETQRRRLAGIQKALPREAGRSVLPANLHVTVAFLGNVIAARQMGVERIAAEWAVPELDLAFTRFAYWPKARLICLEAPEFPAVFLEAIAQLHAGLRQAGFAIEARPFRAHVTLVRNVARLPATGLPPLPDPFPWPVRALSLVASTPAPGGSVYAVLSKWPSDGAHSGDRAH